MVPSETDPALILLVEFNLVNTSAPESTQRTTSGKTFPRGTDWERRPSLSHWLRTEKASGTNRVVLKALPCFLLMNVSILLWLPLLPVSPHIGKHLHSVSNVKSNDQLSRNLPGLWWLWLLRHPGVYTVPFSESQPLQHSGSHWWATI